MKANKSNTSELYKRQIRQYETILQTAGEGICGLDENGEIIFANPAAVKMLGWEGFGINGISFVEAFFSADSIYRENPEICPIFFALHEGESSHVNTETFFRRDGSEILVEYICVPIKEHERISGAVITFQDITEQREIELSIAEARDAALTAANTKAAFLANMSHEIRTPLNGVIGMTNLLLETNLENQQLHYAEIIKNSAELLLGIVNDILDFSKIEARKLELETVDFNLETLVQNTIELFAPEAKRKNLALRCEIEKDIQINVRGDAARLRQVLNNLVSNALKFTEHGEIIVGAAKKQETTKEISLFFSIKDSGIGIEANQALFLPFTQADVSTTRRFGGTGLGLAICKELVELMKGEIGFESELGKGTNFWFTVRLEKSSVATEQLRDTNDELRSGIRQQTAENQPAEILIVDDNWINQEIALGLLRNIGLMADVANNGVEALEKLSKKSYKLVLMDFQMPLMDGFEATRRIRQLENGYKKTKIVAMTASATAEDFAKCVAAGMDDYLCKPITKNDLATILEKHLETEKTLQTLDSQTNIIQHNLSSLIDPVRLDSFLEIEAKGEANFLNEILQIYIKHSTEIVEKLVKAFENKDIDNLGKLLHSLKGSSGNVGLREISALCSQLETHLENKNWQQIEVDLRSLLKKNQRICQLLIENL